MGEFVEFFGIVFEGVFEDDVFFNIFVVGVEVRLG